MGADHTEDLLPRQAENVQRWLDELSDIDEFLEEAEREADRKREAELRDAYQAGRKDAYGEMFHVRTGRK